MDSLRKTALIAGVLYLIVVPPESWRVPYAASRSGAAVFS